MRAVVPLIVVRHAHAGSRSAWEGDDRFRPLSRRGEVEAGRLAEELSVFGPTRILSSPATRCRQTVEPLATRLGSEVADDKRLFEGSARADLQAVLDDGHGETVVLCTHGDVVPVLLAELVDRGVRPVDALRWPKASAWIVERSDRTDPGLARYLAPPGHLVG